MTITVEVKPGQIWADNDPRSAGWTLRVDAIDGSKAVCTILLNTDSGIATWQARISLSRFKPTSTGWRWRRSRPAPAGYRLVSQPT